MYQVKDEVWLLEREDELAGVPLLVMANKQDLPKCMSTAQLQDALGLWHVSRPWLCVGTCATSGDGLYEGLDWLSAQVKEPLHGAVPRPPSPQLQRLDFDPATSSCLDGFSRIQQSTQCPFARRAKLWGGKRCVRAGDAAANAPALRDFVARSEAGETLDGFVLELASDDAKGDVWRFGRSIKAALTELSDKDPRMDGCMRKKYIGERGWCFRFAGATFFVTSFAPCYPKTSPRYGFGCESAFVLLQPERSFLRHNLCDNHVEAQQPPSIRDRIRTAFRQAGRGYFLPPTTRYAPAPFIVRPVHEDDAPFEWWQDDEESTTASEGTDHTEMEVFAA